MIHLSNLHKTYPQRDGTTVHALRNINLDVAEGEICGAIGHSGAGKSTLIRCVNLLERPTEGQVIVNGQDLTALSMPALRQARHQMGMIFQHFNLLSTRTVFDNIALPLELARKSRRDIEAAIAPLLALTGLTEKRNIYPAQLSGGQKQRVAIARALASRPKVLLCDEATSALDPHTTQAILALLKDINKEFGITLLVITHEMDVIKQLCQRVAVMHQGEIIEHNDVLSFFTQAKTPLGQRFVQAARRQELSDIIKQRLHSKPDQLQHPVPLLRIFFVGKSAKDPVLSSMQQQFPVAINILQGNLETIQDTPIGIMVIEMRGEEAAQKAAIYYLKQQQLTVEELGYVERDVVAAD